MTETTPAERRERYAAKISKGGFGQSLRELTDAAISVADAEQAELRARLADYENRITWETTCGSCARVLDSSIRETERAEQAEAATEAYRLALSLALGLGTGANWEALRDRAAELAAAPTDRDWWKQQAHAVQTRAVVENRATVLREAAEVAASFDIDASPQAVATELRRLFDAASGPGRADDKTQQDETQAEAHPPAVTWEIEAPRRGTWTRWAGCRDTAEEAREDYDRCVEWGGERRPYRLIRIDTTSTVVAEHQPAAVPQPGKEA